MSDTIYRQVAIDAVQGISRLATLPDNDAVVRMSAVEYVLFNLPSAQPEIVRCKNCKWYGKVDKMFYRKNTCTNPRVGMKVGENDFCSYAEAGEAGE